MAKGQTNAIIGGGEGIPTSVCTNIVVKAGNGQATLTWTDPPASETVHGVDIVWKSTSVRYKANSAPTSATDGTLVVTETTRNQYSSNALTITGLTNGTTYYISVYPKSESGAVNADATQIVSVKPSDYSTWTVNIDQSNSNPLSCCTYADSATGMTKGSSDWDDIFGYKPCIMKDGVVQGYLNPNDFTKYENGSSAPITDTTYDVMIEFPRRGLSITTSGNIITVKLTNDPNNSNFQYYAHKRGSIQKDYFYLGAYDATGSSSKLGSNSGKTPLTNVSITNFINYAHNRGTGYEIMGFYQWTYVQALYVLKYGNLNSQSAVGMGYVSGSSAQSTGATNSNGMCYGSTSITSRVKLFGLEDLWGNVYQFICGLYSDSSRNLLTTTDNFGASTSSSSWEFSVSSGVSSNSYGYMTKAQGTNNGGFVLKVANGSSTTYFSDFARLYASYFPRVGGGWDDGDDAGVFGCVVYHSASDAYSSIGSRLMFL